MIARFRNVWIMSCAGLLACPAFCGQYAAWVDAPTGKCYPSVGRYVEKTFGEKYRDDDNLKIFPLPDRGGKKNGPEFLWFVDMTPAQNYTSLLFRVDSKSKACVILTALASTTVSLEEVRNGKLPRYVVTEETVPYGWATRVTYEYEPNKKYYLPKYCAMVDEKRRLRKTSCSRAFVQ